MLIIYRLIKQLNIEQVACKHCWTVWLQSFPMYLCKPFECIYAVPLSINGVPLAFPLQGWQFT